MRICLISPLPPPIGGVSKWTALVHHAAARYPEIELIQVDTAPRWRAIDDLSVIKRTVGGGIQFIGNYFSFLRAIRKKPDIVHLITVGSLSVFANWIFCATARLFDIPVIYHVRFGRIPEIALRDTLEWKMLSSVSRMSSLVIAISQDTCRTIQQYLPKDRVVYIPNPIDLSDMDLEKQNPSQRKVALFLGWVLPAKGVSELVQAWSELVCEGWDLLLAGPGGIEYQRQLIEKFRPANLKFLGKLSHGDAMQLMANCDLFVLPSYTEGFPNVILEAMALGKPIIASAVGAIPEMLSGDCGLLIHAKEPEELKDALELLIHDSSLGYRFGRNALEKVKKEYSIDAVFPLYIKTWKSLLKFNTFAN